MAHIISSGHSTVSEFLEALGIDSENAVEFHMHIVPNDVVRIHVVSVATDTQMEKAGTMFREKKFQLVEIENDDRESDDKELP